MTKAGKTHTRRPVNYWSKFNEWWRLVLDETGRRPDAAAINRWYEEHAHEIWSPNDMPTMLETRIHAKCLRSVDEVRNYFRAYRAQRRADAAARLETNGGDDHGDETDTDAVAARIANRRSGGGAGNKPNAGPAVHVQRGGVSKVVTSAIRPGRPHGQSGAQSGHFLQGPYSYNNSSSMDVTHAASLPDSTAPSAWWPPAQRLQVSQRQQTSAVSGPIAGTSVVITGIPRADLRYNAISLTQPASPAKADHSAGATVNGQQTGCLDVDVGDLPYDGPCSSVSTASLDDLFGLNDDGSKDDAAFGVPHASSSVLAVAGAQQQAVAIGAAQHPQQTPQVSVHQQQTFLQHQQQQQQHGLLLPQQRPQPQLRSFGAGLSDDLRSIFDDCIGAEPLVHAELTLLSHHPKQQHPQHTQGRSSRKSGHGCVETSLWQPSVTVQRQPVQAPQQHIVTMAASHRPPQVQHQQAPQLHLQQQQSSLSLLCGWPAGPRPCIDPKQQQQQGGGNALACMSTAPVSLAGATWGREPKGIETSPATPMEGVVCDQGAIPSWLPNVDIVKPPELSPNVGCAVNSGVPCNRGGQELPSAGPSPDAQSTASHVAPAVQVKTEPIEPPQPPPAMSEYPWTAGNADPGAATRPPSCPAGPRAQPQPTPPQPPQPQSMPSWMAHRPNPEAATSGGVTEAEQRHKLQVSRFGSSPNLCSSQPFVSDAHIARSHQHQVTSARAAHLRPDASAGRLFQQPSLHPQQPQQLPRLDLLAPMPVPPLVLPPFPPRPSTGDRVYHRSPSLGSSSVAHVGGAAPMGVTITSPWTTPNQQQQQAVLREQQLAGPPQQQQSHQGFMSVLQGLHPAGQSAPASAPSVHQLGQDASAIRQVQLGPSHLPSLSSLLPAANSLSALDEKAAAEASPASRVASWSHSTGSMGQLSSPFVIPHLVQQQQGAPFAVSGMSCGTGVPRSASAGGAQATSQATGRRHSQPSENTQPYMAMLQSQPQRQPPDQGQQQVGCLMTELMQRPWSGSHLSGGPGSVGLSLTTQIKEVCGARTRDTPHRTLQELNANSGTLCAAAELASGGPVVMTTAAAPCDVDLPATAAAPRPTIARTLSAPAGDGVTPRAAASAAVVTALPTASSVAQPQPGPPGATPRQQLHALGGPGGFGTPGLGAGFSSPAGCWGDRALTELEGDSMWLNSMLGPEITPPFF